MNEIGKLDKNSMEDIINASYTAGKINKDDREILMDRISEYYKNERNSEDWYGTRFRWNVNYSPKLMVIGVIEVHIIDYRSSLIIPTIRISH